MANRMHLVKEDIHQIRSAIRKTVVSKISLNICQQSDRQIKNLQVCSWYLKKQEIRFILL